MLDTPLTIASQCDLLVLTLTHADPSSQGTQSVSPAGWCIPASSSIFPALTCSWCSVCAQGINAWTHRAFLCPDPGFRAAGPECSLRMGRALRSLLCVPYNLKHLLVASVTLLDPAHGSTHIPGPVVSRVPEMPPRVETGRGLPCFHSPRSGDAAAIPEADSAP